MLDFRWSVETVTLYLSCWLGFRERPIWSLTNANINIVIVSYYKKSRRFCSVTYHHLRSIWIFFKNVRLYSTLVSMKTPNENCLSRTFCVSYASFAWSFEIVNSPNFPRNRKWKYSHISLTIWLFPSQNQMIFSNLLMRLYHEKLV